MRHVHSLVCTAGIAASGAGATAGTITYQVDDGNTPNTAVAVRGTVLNRFAVSGDFSFITAIQVLLYSPGNQTHDFTASVWTDPTGGSPSDATLVATLAHTETFSGERMITFTLASPVDVGAAGASFFLGLTLDNDVYVPLDSSARFTYIQNGSSVPTSMNNASLLPPGTAFIRGIASDSVTNSIPLPSAAALAGSGLVAVGARRRR